MADEVGTDGILADSKGQCWQVGDELAYPDALVKYRTVMDAPDCAAVLLPPSCCSSGVEAALRAHIERSVIGREADGPSASWPVDLLRDGNGRFVGLLTGFRRDAIPLPLFLDYAAGDWGMRWRAAAHLSKAVLELWRGGALAPTRLSPHLIMVVPSSGEVFLAVDYHSALVKGGAEALKSKKAPRSFHAEDLAFHLYCLLRSEPSRALEEKLWPGATLDVPGGAEPSLRAMREELSASLRPPSSGRRGARVRRRAPAILREIPAEFRIPISRALEGGYAGNSEGFARQICGIFDGSTAGVSPRASVRGRGRHRAVGITRADEERLERRSWGVSSLRRRSTFWGLTLGAALALGLCSMLNGFSPLDLALDEVVERAIWFVAGVEGDAFLESFRSVGTVGARWQYLPASLVGSMAFNALASRPHPLGGMRLGSYCLSMVASLLMMAVPRAVYRLLLAGGFL